MGAGKSARDRARGQNPGRRPIDHSFGNEVKCGHNVYQERERILHRVHFMDILESQNAERGQHQDTDAGAKISAVNRNQDLKNDREPEPAPRHRLRRLQAKKSREEWLRGKQNRREQNQERHQTIEQPLGCFR